MSSTRGGAKEEGIDPAAQNSLGDVRQLTRLRFPVRHEWRPPPGLRSEYIRAVESAMLKPYLWSKSVPRVELDQRTREARLRLEEIERLLVPRVRVTNRWLRWTRRLGGIGVYRDGPRGGQIGAPRHDRRGCRTPTGDASFCRASGLSLRLA